MVRWVAMLAACACGRIGFDPVGTANGDGPTTSGDGSTTSSDGRIADGGTCTFSGVAECVDDIVQVSPGTIGDVTQNIASYGNGTSAACGGQNGGDFGLQINALQTGTYRFVITADFTPVIYGPYNNTTCTGAATNCQAAAGTLEFSMNAGTSSVIVVDTNGACGVFNIHYEHVP